MGSSHSLLFPGPFLPETPVPHLSLFAQPAVLPVSGWQVPLLHGLEEHQLLRACLLSEPDYP